MVEPQPPRPFKTGLNWAIAVDLRKNIERPSRSEYRYYERHSKIYEQIHLGEYHGCCDCFSCAKANISVVICAYPLNAAQRQNLYPIDPVVGSWIDVGKAVYDDRSCWEFLVYNCTYLDEPLSKP